MKFFWKLTCMGLVVNSFGSALAQSSYASPQSSLSLDINWSKYLKKVKADFNTIAGYRTPRKEIAAEGEGKAEVGMTPEGKMLNEFQVGYELSKTKSLSFVGIWVARNSAEENQRVQWLDPYTKFEVEKIVHTRNFELGSDIRIGIPLSEQSTSGEKAIRIASEQKISYQFGKSRFRFEGDIYTQYNSHTSDRTSGFDFRYEPGLNYYQSDSTHLRVAFETRMTNEEHTNLRLIDNREPVYKFGVGHKINKNIEIFPFVDFEKNSPSTKQALYAAQLRWTIL